MVLNHSCRLQNLVRCTLSLYDSVKPAWHFWHLYGLSPVCSLMCLLTEFLWVNSCPQNGQIKSSAIKLPWSWNFSENLWIQFLWQTVVTRGCNFSGVFSACRILWILHYNSCIYRVFPQYATKCVVWQIFDEWTVGHKMGICIHQY